MTPALPIVALLALAACNPAGGGRATLVPTDGSVNPALAACLTAVGRPDVAAHPDAPMSDAEIAGLVDCTADGASG